MNTNTKKIMFAAHANISTNKNKHNKVEQPPSLPIWPAGTLKIARILQIYNHIHISTNTNTITNQVSSS